MEETQNKIGSFDTTMRIIDAIREHDNVGVTELANKLDLPKSTVFSHLSTLKSHGVVNSTNGKYRLGFRLLELGGHMRERMDVYKAVKPELDELARQTGELVNLMVEEQGRGVYLYLASGEDSAQLDTYPGKRVDLYCTAMGKVILAYLPDERQEEIIRDTTFEAHTKNTITDSVDLREELEEIRSRGFATDDEERGRGLRCVAAPLRIQEQVKGAISVSGPVSRMKEERFRDKLPEQITDTASNIEIKMRY